MASTAAQQFDPLTRPQRLFAGILLLLLVDVIWVLSSEFTVYIFKDLFYDKPYLSTYFKTCLFSTYLLGFLIYAPWREECRRESHRLVARVNVSNGDYHRVNVQDHDEEVMEDTESQDEQASENGAGASSSSHRGSNSSLLRSLSSPLFVPANIPESGKSSGTEESDAESRSASSSTSRRVRFKRLAEVVEMNPAEAMAANLARLSYSASLRAQAALRRAAQRLSVSDVAKLALAFTLPWFLGNYCYQMALSKTEAAVVNILSSSSSFFTLLLSALFPSDSSDQLSLSKLCAVIFSICGVILVSWSDMRIEDADIPKGALWALAGALFYSTYIVLLRRKVNHEENMDAPMFFGFVGLFSTVLLWPGILIGDLTATETFEVPSLRQFELLVINGLIGTVLSELLWLWGCFYTSSLLATLSIGLTIPLSILADILWRNRHYETIFIMGVVPMFFSFFIIAMLTHYQDWDPLLDLFKVVWARLKALCCCGDRDQLRSSAPSTSFVFDRQERESLINQDLQHHHGSL